jgi:hypothetical protein
MAQNIATPRLDWRSGCDIHVLCLQLPSVAAIRLRSAELIFTCRAFPFSLALAASLVPPLTLTSLDADCSPLLSLVP